MAKEISSAKETALYLHFCDLRWWHRNGSRSAYRGGKRSERRNQRRGCLNHFTGKFHRQIQCHNWTSGLPGDSLIVNGDCPFKADFISSKFDWELLWTFSDESTIPVGKWVSTVNRTIIVCLKLTSIVIWRCLTFGTNGCFVSLKVRNSGRRRDTADRGFLT